MRELKQDNDGSIFFFFFFSSEEQQTKDEGSQHAGVELNDRGKNSSGGHPRFQVKGLQRSC